MNNYALIGDLHSQVAPLVESLLYCSENNLTPIFLGDVFDSRCDSSNSVRVYRILKEAQKDFPGMQILRSNHQDKLERWLKGNSVKVMSELQRTIDEFALSDVPSNELLKWLESLPYGFCFRDENGKEYRCSHAFFPGWVDVPPYENTVTIYDVPKKAKQLMMYGPSHTDHRGRVFWWNNTSERDWVRVAGHYHVVHTDEKSLVLDAGCGGKERSWFCSEPPGLVLWDTTRNDLVEFSV
jgi:hypothetical protein